MSARAKAVAAPPPAVTRAPAAKVHRSCACQGHCDDCSKKKKVHRAAAGPRRGAVPAQVHGVLASAGQPLDAATRRKLEPRLGRSLAGVRVHTGADAAAAADAIHAHAYTVGQDIVFAGGQHRPDTPEGQRLLAHEVVHTVQQAGLARSADDAVSQPHDALEVEAERLADALVAPEGAAPAAPLAVSAGDGGAGIHRTPAPGAPPAPAGAAGPDSDVTAIGSGHVLEAHFVRAVRRDGNRVEAELERFPLPSGKGAVEDYWNQLAGGGSLMAVFQRGATGDDIQSALRNRRSGTSSLKRRWESRVGWRSNEVADRWAAAAAQPPVIVTDRPYHAGEVCELDHIVELQLGGGQDDRNIQLLGERANRSAGPTIQGTLERSANAVFAWLDTQPGPRVRQVLLRIKSVVQAASADEDRDKCQAIEKRVTDALVEGSNVDPARRYRIASSGRSAVLDANPAPQQTPLTGGRGHNRYAAELFPGFRLGTLKRQRDPSAKDTLDARVLTASALSDAPGADRIPMRFSTHRALEFEVQPAGGSGPDAMPGGNLKLKEGANSDLQFYYPHLSQGRLRVTRGPDGKPQGTGSLRPSIPLLRNVEMRLDLGENRLRASLDASSRIRSPIPHSRVTDASLGVDLLPEFVPNGQFAMEFGPEGHPYATASLRVFPENNQLAADGALEGHIRGLRSARGVVRYRGGQWSGNVRLEAEQADLPIPGARMTEGTVEVGLSPRGLTYDGAIGLALGQQQVRLAVSRAPSGGPRYTGEGTFHIPRLRPVRMTLVYDGHNLYGTAATGVEFAGLVGEVNVIYRNGRFSGTGTLTLNRGRANGSVTVNLDPQGRVGGQGSLRYRLTDKLVGNVGVDWPIGGPLRVRGGLEFPEPIRLFERRGGAHTIRAPPIKVPIVGVSVGPVAIGLVGRIEFGVGFDYGFGPGVLRDVRLVTAFNPLEDDANLEVEGGGTFHLPASAGVSVTVSGGLSLDAGIASVSGMLDVVGRLGLEGAASAAIQLRYRQGRFAIEATPAIRMQPVLELRLQARAVAEAGALGITYRKEFAWQLASYRWGSGLEWGMEATVGYDSAEGLRLPSAQSIRWIKPDIDARALMGGIMGSAGRQERDA